VASEKGKLDISHKLFEWAKEVISQEELNNKTFLAKDIKKRTAWNVAAEKGKIEELRKLWE